MIRGGRSQPVVWTDISNSQPLIFGLLLLDYGEHGSLVGVSAFRERKRSRKREEGGRGEREGRTPIMFPIGNNTPSADRRAGLPADVTDYISTCEQGRLYEVLMARSATQHSRDDFKTFVFQEVFYRNKNYQSDLMDLFGTLYPTAAKMIRYVRSIEGGKGSGLLARMMQRYESDLVIKTVCQRVMTERPDLPILTIHDAVGTTKEHAGCVRTIIREEYQRLGITPHVKAA